MADVAKVRRAAFLRWVEQNGLNGNKIARATGLPYTTLNSYIVGKTASFGGDIEAIIARAYGSPVEALFGWGVEEGGGGAREPNHLRAWREHKRMTLEQVAKALSTTPSVIELLESGDYEVSQKWYRALAPVYDTTPGHLMDYDPAQIPADIVQIATRMNPENRARLAIIAQALEAPTGTNG